MVHLGELDLDVAQGFAHLPHVAPEVADSIDVPHGLLWGVGIGVPVRGPVRVFGELLGQGVLGGAMKLTAPLFAADGSMSGLASSDRRPIDAVLGAQFQSRGFSAGAGLTWALRHVDRGTVGQVGMGTDRLGFLARLSYHPGVRVYTPPPPPPPPPPPVPPAPPANRPPVVAVSCDPCEVEFGDEVRLRADASDPDGDPLDFRWNAPTGTFIDATDRATTRWQAPAQEGPLPITATVADGRGGSASDVATVLVNAPPPPPTREFVFEDIHFDFDRYSLRQGATRVLDEVVAALAEDPDLGIQIEGHTCNIGTNERVGLSELAVAKPIERAIELHLPQSIPWPSFTHVADGRCPGTPTPPG